MKVLPETQKVGTPVCFLSLSEVDVPAPNLAVPRSKVRIPNHFPESFPDATDEKVSNVKNESFAARMVPSCQVHLWWCEFQVQIDLLCRNHGCNELRYSSQEWASWTRRTVLRDKTA